MKVELEILENDDFKYKNHLITLEVWHDCNVWYEIEGITEEFQTLKQAIEYIDDLEVKNESL